MKSNTIKKNWRAKLHEIIYEADTFYGKAFDIVIFLLIILSIILVMLESVAAIDAKYHEILDIAEWSITILFSMEYIARIMVLKKPLRYVFSFYGIIDFLSTIPKYLALFFIGTHTFGALRALRLMRVFRVLKLARFIGESNQLVRALKASKAKISVFLFAVLILCIILGTIMYLVEGPDRGFTSIPRSVYWAIVTLTTVGYGDIAPTTAFGQFIAAIVMILGYGIIAVPTGIVTSELALDHKKIHTNTQACPNCGTTEHKDTAKHCYNCGNPLHENTH